MRVWWSRTSRLYLGTSVVLAAMAGLLVRGYVARAATGAGKDGPDVAVVVALHPIARGTSLRRTDLRLTAIPARYAPPGSFHQISRAAGRVVLADLAPGEVVTQTRLARVRAGPVASLLPRGLRAFAVPTSLPPGAIVAGDHVDILATFSTGQVHTETVVSSVQVLFVLGSTPTTGSGLGGAGQGPSGGAGLDAAGSGAATPTTLILLVSEDQEQRLAFARAFADLAVAIAP